MKANFRSKFLRTLKTGDSFLSHLLNFVVFPSKLTTRSSDEILLIRPGGLGDLVLLVFALRDFDVNFKNLTFLIETRSEPWAKLNNLKYICYDRDFMKIFFLKKFVNVYCTEQYFGLSVHVARFLLARHGSLFGFNTNKIATRFTEIALYEEDVHEKDNFICLLDLGLEKNEEKFVADTRLTTHNSDYQVVVLGGFESESRTLELKDWVYLVKKYRDASLDLKIVSAPKDFAFAKKLAEEMVVTEISNSFEQAIHLVSNSNSILTVDSGLVHVSSFYGIPAVVLFTSGNPNKWRPLAPGSIILTNLFACQPCALFGQVPRCDYNFRCKTTLIELKTKSFDA
jgi:ADP-heptose:LPS heptosyltransferase